jgi:hypothetical protein
MSPIVDGDLVIVSAAVSNWGSAAARSHRFIGLDKRNGDVLYVSNPGGRPYDTAYASPIIGTINGVRLLIAGARRWRHPCDQARRPARRRGATSASKRAINTGAAVSGNTVFISHGDENLEGVELGLLAAIDGTQRGDIKTTKWAVKGIEFSYSAPIVDGTRLYQLETDRRFAHMTSPPAKSCGISMSERRRRPRPCSPTARSTSAPTAAFFIVRPQADGGDPEQGGSAEQQQQLLRIGRHAEQILGNAADLARAHLLRVERRDLRDRPRRATSPTGSPSTSRRHADGRTARSAGVATELNLEPGQTVKLHARLFDANGRFFAKRRRPRGRSRVLKAPSRTAS